MTNIKSSALKVCLFFLLACSIWSCTKEPIEPITEEPIIEEPVVEPSDTMVTDTTMVDTTVAVSYTYLALGDSYTIGQSVPEEMRWPNQLRDTLLTNDINISEVKFIAQTGWTTTSLLNAIDSQSPVKHDVVSLLIGVNNQFQGGSFESFKTEFDDLLNIAIDLCVAGDKVFVVSIPDYGVTPFGSSDSEQIAEELDMYNAYMEGKSAALNIPFINITEISRTLGSGDNALAPDNLHPSGFQYTKWVEEIYPIVVDLF